MFSIRVNIGHSPRSASFSLPPISLFPSPSHTYTHRRTTHAHPGHHTWFVEKRFSDILALVSECKQVVSAIRTCRRSRHRTQFACMQLHTVFAFKPWSGFPRKEQAGAVSRVYSAAEHPKVGWQYCVVVLGVFLRTATDRHSGHRHATDARLLADRTRAWNEFFQQLVELTTNTHAHTRYDHIHAVAQAQCSTLPHASPHVLC